MSYWFGDQILNRCVTSQLLMMTEPASWMDTSYFALAIPAMKCFRTSTWPAPIHSAGSSVKVCTARWASARPYHKAGLKLKYQTCSRFEIAISSSFGDRFQVWSLSFKPAFWYQTCLWWGLRLSRLIKTQESVNMPMLHLDALGTVFLWIIQSIELSNLIK